MSDNKTRLLKLSSRYRNTILVSFANVKNLFLLHIKNINIYFISINHFPQINAFSKFTEHSASKKLSSVSDKRLFGIGFPFYITQRSLENILKQYMAISNKVGYHLKQGCRTPLKWQFEYQSMSKNESSIIKLTMNVYRQNFSFFCFWVEWLTLISQRNEKFQGPQDLLSFLKPYSGTVKNSEKHKTIQQSCNWYSEKSW